MIKVLLILLFFVPLVGAGQVALHWTWTGDNGTGGQATAIYIRYCPRVAGPIDTEAKWASATIVSPTRPSKLPGARDTLIISNLISDSSYYFSARVSDGFNLGGLSNSPLLRTYKYPNPPDSIRWNIH